MEDSELLIDKMCTKLCQLTRVVYLLNNKYLDAQSTIDTIINIYESELDNFVREANIVNTKLKEKVAYLSNQGRLSEQIDKKVEEISVRLKQEKEEEINKCKNNIAEIEIRHKKKEEEMEKKHKLQIIKMSTELDEVKKMFKEKLLLLNTNKSNEIKALREENKKIKEESDKKAESLEGKINELLTRESEYENNIKKMREEISEKDEEISALIKENERKGSRILEVENENKGLKKTTEDQRQKLNKLVSEFNKITNEAKIKSEEVSKLRQEKEKLLSLEAKVKNF